MPSFELPIRSLSILFILCAIIAILWFPDSPHTPDLAHAFFYWFLALGVVRWIEHSLGRLLPTDNDGKTYGIWYYFEYLIAIPGTVAQIVLLCIGVRHFYTVLSSL
jgi:hypothetical protein